MNPKIEQAIAIIDAAPANPKGDYVIEPAKHADDYRETAPELAALLDSSGARTLAQEYQYWDDEANKNQRLFQSCSRKARGWVFATAGFTALSLALALLLGAGAPAELSQFAQGANLGVALAALLAAVSGAIAGMYLNRIQAGRLLESWKESRAQAESYRRDYFTYVSQAAADAANPTFLLLLQVEYFRRYQFEVQYSFYQRRADDHRHDADRSLKLSSAALAAVVLLNSLSSAGSLSASNWRLIAAGAFALLAQAFANMVFNREEVQQNRRKAELYAKTRTALTQLAANIDGIRQAVLEGNKELFTHFVNATHEVLSKEHEEWLRSFDDAHSAVGQLVSQLDEWKHKTSLQNPSVAADNKHLLESRWEEPPAGPPPESAPDETPAEPPLEVAPESLVEPVVETLPVNRPAKLTRYAG